MGGADRSWGTRFCAALIAACTSCSAMSMSRLKSNRSEERRVGKECRSLCDWSSDVCSSDLVNGGRRQILGHQVLRRADRRLHFLFGDVDVETQVEQIGRASCRERV